MKTNIRESLFQIIFIWATTMAVLMTRHMVKTVNTESIDMRYFYIYMISMGIFVIVGSFYAYHQYKNSKNKNIFEEPSFEEDEREIFLENESRKKSYFFLKNSFIITILFFLFWMKATISINYVVIYVAVLFSIAEIIKSVVWVKEYNK